jgi:Lon protease-like protein
LCTVFTVIMSDAFRLPVLSLRQIVFFPGVAAPLPVGRRVSLAAVEAALAGDRRMIALTQRENLDDVVADELYRVGVVIRIAQIQRVKDGIEALVYGEARARVSTFEAGPHGELIATASPMLDYDLPTPTDASSLSAKLRERAAELGARRGIPLDKLNQFLDGLGGPGELADLMAHYLDLSIESKQRLLEIDSVDERLRTLLFAIQQQLRKDEPNAPTRENERRRGDAWDVFISHAREDKEAVARPLALELRSRGLNVWFDEFTLSLGDSLRRSIDRGLAECRFGVVVLSPCFFAKEWPMRELDGLTSRENEGRKVILPVWHGIEHPEVAKFSPTLADRLAVTTDRGITALADAIEKAIRA